MNNILLYKNLLAIILSTVFALFCSLANSVYATELQGLTATEIAQIDTFVKRIDVDKGVGQFFMINLPVNYIETFNKRNWRKGLQDDTPVHKKLIEHGFGSILLQSSNFQYLNSQAETEEERISLITGFVNNLQYRAISTNNKGVKVPLFVAVDFEGPMVNTIRDTLIAPPPALTLATSQNKQLIEKTGKIVGYQLANSGINMLLGPVLDIDKTSQGHNNRVLGNRSFSSDANGVITAAAYYTKGLREAGLTVIGKHFPGLGFVNGDPHNKIVSFQGTANDLKEHLQPYNELKPLLNGIMTSHVFLPFLDNKEPATFNKPIIQFLRKQMFSELPSLKALDYKDKLVLSDDLGMKAIIDHSTDQGKVDYADMAIQAIEAGHDIIMFAKVVSDKSKLAVNKDTIRISELIEVKKSLADYLRNEQNRKKYIASLKRIMLAKAAAYKLHGGEIKHFIAGNMSKVIHSQLSVPDSVKGADGFIDHKEVKKSYEKIIESSYLVLNGKLPSSLNRSSNICIFRPEKYKDNYRGIIGSYKKEKVHFSDAIHNTTDKKLSTKIRKIKEHIDDNACNVIFVVANNGLNINRIINIVDHLKNKNQESSDLILLLHQSPIALPKVILDYSKLTIMGAFTQHHLSYDVDVKAIKKDLPLQQANQLTIGYNGNNVNLSIKKPAIEKIKFDYTTDIAKNIKSQQKLLAEHREALKTQQNKYDQKIKQLTIENEEKIKKIPDEDINNNKEKAVNAGFYSEILLILIIITGIIIILYVTDKSKNDISRVANSKDATFMLIRNVLTSPQLIIVTMLFTLIIFLLLAHLDGLALHELFSNYLR